MKLVIVLLLLNHMDYHWLWYVVAVLLYLVSEGEG